MGHVSGATVCREKGEKEARKPGGRGGLECRVKSVLCLVWVDEVTWILLMYEDSLTRRLSRKISLGVSRVGEGQLRVGVWNT